MNHATTFFFTLVLAVGCDTLVPAKSAAVATKTAGAAVRADKPLSETPAVSGHVGSLSECLSTCDGSAASRTDRTTCRLNCETAYGAEARGTAATAQADDTIARAASCLNRCQGANGPTDTCLAECKTTASVAASAPSTQVLDELASCLQSCHLQEGVRPTDRATCELNCEQVARVASTPPPSSAPGS
ncbi:hypothetical protein [Nannocystis sp. SCPEA4]|uniref:hypothetical protein n=1 Tax=Nannocystis sp. SCPEA4 TaxID=2996787 RepID=UPI00227208E9|nr:hypothetical protein [Nannocystis sp. SCPEA4]MCY1059556.1 hypothetical protein [Nannocystis sp. SCPEA4]